MAIRIMIVDDQPLIRSGLRLVLDAPDDMEVVSEASDGADAVSTARESQPDVVLMDLNMPLISGVEATVQLLRQADPPRVLALTTFNTDDMAIEALRAGASGFLLKDVCSEELVAAVRTVAVGGTAMSPDAMAKLVNRAGRRMPLGRPRLEEQLATLTASELQVLGLLGKGLTNQQISQELYLSVASVKTYVSRLFDRLGLDNRTQAAILAYEAGLADTVAQRS